MTTSNDLRAMFVDYFAERGHTRVAAGRFSTATPVR